MNSTLIYLAGICTGVLCCFILAVFILGTMIVQYSRDEKRKAAFLKSSDE